MNRYVVESPIFEVLPTGERRQATARVYVATEERAKEIAAGAPDRTWREVTEVAQRTT